MITSGKENRICPRDDCLLVNNVSIKTTKDTKSVGGFRWKIEHFHREVKQLTEASKCQVIKGRKQQNHICIIFL